MTKNTPKKYVTSISQREVKILPMPEDSIMDGKKWTLVEYISVKDKNGKPLTVYAPNYTLEYEFIPDYSQVKVVKR